MRNLLSIAATALAVGLWLAPVAAAQDAGSVTPRIENARVEKRALAGSLTTEVTGWAEHAAEPQWLGYAVPQISGDHSVCCGNYNGSWSNGCGRCRLERGRDDVSVNSEQPGTVKLEGPRYLLVLLRAERNHVMKIRMASEDWAIDAGGLPFVWITGVNPSQSVDLLKSFVVREDLDSHEGERMSEGALAAIAMHADPAADRALELFVQTSQPESLRKHTAFWLGEARGAAGLRVLQGMAKNDPSAEVRAQVAFAFSVSREPPALADMIGMAHNDDNPRVRGQALFWLAQKAGKKAVGAITGAIDNDPDTEVKKKAVFALSQLPKDEGVPKLIEVAQTNHNREVRKQAMFWLGQSNDPRALAFFEKVLSR